MKADVPSHRTIPRARPHLRQVHWVPFLATSQLSDLGDLPHGSDSQRTAQLRNSEAASLSKLTLPCVGPYASRQGRSASKIQPLQQDVIAI